MRVSPRSVIRPRARRSPALDSLGTSPRYACTWWALCNRPTSSSAATKAKP